MDKEKDFVVEDKDTLCSDTTQYMVKGFIGEGSSSRVASCVNLKTEQDMILKISKKKNCPQSEKESAILDFVSILDPGKASIASLFDKFTFKEHTCLIFEKLDRSLFQLLKERDFIPLTLPQIRPVAQQLLTALDALQTIGVIHADLRINNVMLVKHNQQPFRVKLIDFSKSFTVSQAAHLQGETIQVLSNRAPEVSLGLPISEAIDTWSLGCLLAYLYLGTHLFKVECEYKMMQSIVDILGQPSDHLLSAGKYSKYFFMRQWPWDQPKWRLKTPMEFFAKTCTQPAKCDNLIHDLDDLISVTSKVTPVELEDKRQFVSLLRNLLCMDPEQRISPALALKHPFITMDHLPADQSEYNLYVADSFTKMHICPVDEAVTCECRDEEDHTSITTLTTAPDHPLQPACELQH